MVWKGISIVRRLMARKYCSIVPLLAIFSLSISKGTRLTGDDVYLLMTIYFFPLFNPARHINKVNAKAHCFAKTCKML
jgi:hypothetical protein